MNADLVASIILSAGGLTLILVGRSKDRQARRLRQAKSLELDAIPEQLERAGSSYVATAGFVRSAGQARVCDYAINECGEPLTAVLYERQLERLFRQWNAKTLGWDEGRELISVDRIETPFLIRSTFCTTEAAVVAAGAVLPELQIVHQHVEANNRGAVEGILGSLAELVQTRVEMGVRITERALPEGTAVTVVAQAATPQPGRVELRSPENGDPFIISLGDRATLSSSAKRSASAFFWGGSLLLILAVGLGAGAMWLRWEHQRVKEEKLKREVESKQRTLEIMQSMGRDIPYSEDPQIKELLLCIICCEEPVGAVFLDCGHIACCLSCAKHTKERHKLCPVCRQVIRRAKAVYLP